MTVTAQKAKHEYFAHGQSIRLCNETTGHAVRDVAFCHTPECAAEFARILNEWQVEHGMIRDT